MKIFQPIVSGSFTTSGSVFLKGLTSAAQSNVILIDTASGQLYTTASSALGGGGTVATASFATTASNVQGGTANYIPLWNTATSLSSSVIYQSGSNIGIGTTTPQRTLDSYTRGGAFQGNNYVRLGAGAQGAYGGNNHLEFSYNDYGNIAGGRTADNIVAKIQGNTDVVSATDVGGTLIFSTKDKGGTYLTAPVERMRITSTGNVGIGTTAPTAKIHIAAPGSGSTDIALKVRNSADTSDLFGVLGDGNIVINGVTKIASSATILTINRPDAVGAAFQFSNGVNTAYGEFRWKDASGADLARMSSTGRLGIGTTAPNTALHVSGGCLTVNGALTAYPTNGGIQLYYAGTTGVVAVSQDAGGTNANLAFSVGNNAEKMRITSTGNIGIGTALPEQLIGVNVSGVDSKANGLQFIVPESAAGSARIGIVSNTAGNNRQQAYIKFSKTNTSAGRQGSIGFFTAGLDSDNNTEQMRIDSLGNVGIGTTAPNAKLDVSGSVIITGSLTVTNGITGSLFGTASWAQNVTTATNALSASNFVITSTLQLDGTLTDYASVNSTIVGANNLYTQATGSYTSAFVKYSLNNGANSRAGEFIANWNGTTVTYFDNSTTDIGTTSGIVFSSAIVSSQIQVNATAASSGWKIKTLATFI